MTKEKMFEFSYEISAFGNQEGNCSLEFNRTDKNIEIVSERMRTEQLVSQDKTAKALWKWNVKLSTSDTTSLLVYSVRCDGPNQFHGYSTASLALNSYDK